VIFTRATLCVSAVFAVDSKDVLLAVRPPVCHKPILCPNA